MLPAPNLDDRRFQQLVDEAKRFVQRRCPEWTDHNVSDPGVTLIELFASMTDQVLYRLNRVPDRNYIKFLELMGVRLFPPTAAQVDVTFWLSAPQPTVVMVAKGTETATVRTDREQAMAFTTVEDLAIVPCSLTALMSSVEPTDFRDQFASVEAGKQFFCFDTRPKPGDLLLIGLDGPVPSCAVNLRFRCDIEGVGVDPRNPPLIWEAWTGAGWDECETTRDETGGLNRDGDVVLHVPSGHVASLVGNRRAGWLRCRVVEPEPNQPFYGASPRIGRLVAFTIGGTVGAVNAARVDDEIVGVSDEVAAQRFPVAHPPVVPSEEPAVLEVSTEDGWEEWHCVDSFAESGPDDPHFILDATTGEVQLGPAVRERDGSLRFFGRVPPKGSVLRLRSYLTGGGRLGNVARGTITVLKSSIPYVADVENRAPASGGVDGEDLESVKIRGPLALRTRERAVTAQDYEQIALEAAPEVARIRCVPAGSDPTLAGAVRLLVVPAAADDDIGRLDFEQLIPAEDTMVRITEHLDKHRVIGARLVVEPPVYQGITVVARLTARAHSSPELIQAEATEALYRYFHPISGGPDGTGWPFGRAVQSGEVYSVLQGLRGVEAVEDARLFGADPVSGSRGSAVARLDVAPNALVFSYQHQVLVERT